MKLTAIGSHFFLALSGVALATPAAELNREGALIEAEMQRYVLFPVPLIPHLILCVKH